VKTQRIYIRGRGDNARTFVDTYPESWEGDIALLDAASDNNEHAYIPGVGKKYKSMQLYSSLGFPIVEIFYRLT